MEPTLVERARHGDRDAFAALVAESIDRLYSIAHRILRDPEAARDATQQALLEAWRDLPTLRDATRWEAWTYRLLVRTCYRAARRERRSGSPVRLLPLDAAEGDTVAAVADRDEIERGFRSLSPEHRAVVVLHFYAGLSLTEVARALSIPTGTARSRLHAARNRLRAAIGEGRELPARTEGQPT